MLQKHLIYFEKTFYIILNIKINVNPPLSSSPKPPSIQTHPKFSKIRYEFFNKTRIKYEFFNKIQKTN